MSGKPRAVVLLSGGMDSATTLAMARAEGLECHALSFDYGQLNSIELEAAKKVAGALGAASHRIVRLDMESFRSSALIASSGVSVPKDGLGGEVPSTYVPARNTIFLSFALGLAETIEAEQIFIGANNVDYSGYPDCRPEYIEAFERLANLATRAGVDGSARFRIRAPLLEMGKADIIRKGMELGVDYSMTWSCYDPTEDGRPCGLCDSCRLRDKGLEEAM